IHDGLIGILEPVFAHVADDPYELAGGILEFGTQTFADGDAVADGIFLLPVFLSEGLVDEHDARGIGGVVIAEDASAQQRNFEGGEVVGRYGAPLLITVILVTLGGRLAGDVEREVDTAFDG